MRNRMQFVYHLGVHCTDEDRLLRCLSKNHALLVSDGVVVPAPDRYRPVLRETMTKLRGQPAPPQMQQTVLDAAMDEDAARRVVFSNESFLSAPARALARGKFYAQADQNCRWLRQIFPDDDCEFFLGLRNPATFLPALFSRVKASSFDEFLGGATLQDLQWSEMVARIRATNPDCALTVWCNEDTPLIWPEILRRMTDQSPDMALAGVHDFLAEIMTEAGLDRMESYLQSHPPANEEQRRRVVAAFLDKFAIKDEIEIELDVPGWTENLVEDLTERYEEDIFAIERMDGVEVITP